MMAGQIYSTYATDYRPHLEVTTANTAFTAGSKATMSITLNNGGTLDATEIEAILTSTTAGLTPLNGAQKVINEIGQDESATYDVEVLVDSNVAVGAYVMSLSLNYYRAGQGVVTVTVPISVIVSQPSLPAVKITSSTSKITPGTTTTLHLTLQNIANNKLSDITVSLNPSSALISLTDVVNYKIDELAAGKSASFDISVTALENTPLGAYALTAQVWYANNFNITQKQTISIPIEASSVAVTRSPVVTVENLTPASVNPGEEFTLNLRVNCADASIYNAKAVLSQDATGLISPISPTTVSLGDLAVNGREDFSYTLLLSGSASARDIPLTVSIKYLDSKGVSGVATEIITIPVENLVKFTLMEDITVVAEKGKTTTFEGDILLIGTGKVEFASVEVVPTAPVQNVTGSSEYMGAIDPDSPSPFTLKFKIGNDTATGDYKLNLKITYLNTRNVEETKTISIPLQVVNATQVTNVTNDEGIWGWIKRLFGIQ
jgi:hypothetical protein